MSFSIRLTAEEKKLADSYAKLHAISLGEAFKELYSKKLKTNTISPLLMKHITNISGTAGKVDRLMSFGESLIYEIYNKNNLKI